MSKMPPSRFRVGERIGRLTLRQKVRRGPRVSHNIRLQWITDCDCGTRSTIPEFYMRRAQGPKTDCGHCPDLYADKGLTTQHAETYRTWKNIQMRCYDPTHRGYPRYGGRGIKVCDEWLDPKTGFKAFLSHIGPRPGDDYSIDRYPDTDSDYKPGNVRWATAEQQAANKSKLPKRTLQSQHSDSPSETIKPENLSS